MSPPDTAAALGEDIAARRHLLWLSGIRGAREAVWTMLRESQSRALLFRVTPRQPGDLLPQVLTALGLTFNTESMVGARRELALRLAAAAQTQRDIVVMVDPAHQLEDDDDIGLLLHFFPPGHTTIVFGGQGDPRTWRPYAAARERSLECTAHYVLAPPLAAVKARNADRLLSRKAIAAAPESSALDHGAPLHIDGEQPDSTSTAEASLSGSDEAGLPAASDASAHEPRIAPIIVNGRPDYLRHAQERQELLRQLRRWRTLAVALLVVLVAVGTIEFFDADAPRDNGPVSTATGSPAPAQESTLMEQSSEDVDSRAREASPEQAPMPDQQSSNVERAELPSTPAPAASGQTTPSAPDASATDESKQAGASASTSAEGLAREVTAARAVEPTNTRAATRATGSAPRKRSSTGETRAQARNSGASDGVQQSGTEVDSLAEMYADRAEYELEKGRSEDATASIARGLAIDPDNSRLLSLQVVLRSANNSRAPPFSKTR